MIKINKKLLSVPPYISTSWRDVQSLHQKDGVLFVSLLNGELIQIPHLTPGVVESIFAAHATFLEEEAQEDAQMDQALTAPIHLSVDHITNMLQHDPSQANLPDMPKDMLKKVTDIANLLLPDDPDQIPKAEPHCNCMHCQIARALKGPVTIDQGNDSSELVEEKELTFQQWEVSQTNQHLFSVVNRLDNKETYNVYLGNPIGCTCGRTNCEHLIAVLQS